MRSALSLQTVPGSKEHRARLQALRTVALLEFGKGLLVLVAALSVLFLVDPSDLAGWFLDVLHISPDRHLAQILLRLADSLSNAKIWIVVSGACSYSGLRFAEAYGLWRARPWAEWIALVSGALYLPFEIRLVAHRVTFFHVAVLLINLAVVIFMFYLRIYVPRHEAVNPPVSRIS